MVHNSIFRGYNSIYNQAPHVADADKPAFIAYCLTWHKFLKSHADNEDTSLFLKIQELLDDKTIFEKSHEEHGTLEYISKMYGVVDLTVPLRSVLSWTCPVP